MAPTLDPALIFGPVFALMSLVLVVTVLTLRERMRQFNAQAAILT